MDELSYLEQQDNIDIKKYFFRILANWFWFVLTVFISLSVAYLINRYSDKLYSVNATIIIQDNSNSSYYSNEEIIKGLNVFNQTKNISNEIRIIQSMQLTQRALKELDFNISYFSIGRVRTPEIYSNCFFKIVPDTAHPQLYNYPIYIDIIDEDRVKIHSNGDLDFSKIVSFGDTFENEYLKFQIVRDERINDPGIEKYFVILHNFVSLTSRYNNKIAIEQLDEEGTVLNISTQGHVPRKEVNYLNKLIEVYIKSDLEEKNIIAENTITFIDEQISDVLDSLKNAEAKLLDFRTDNRIINIEQEGLQIKQKYDDYLDQKAAKLIQDKFYDYLEDYIQTAIDSDKILAPPELGINDPLLRSLILKLSGLLEERKSLAFNATEENPSIAMINIRIENAKKSILESIKKLKEANQITIKEIDKKIGQLNLEIEKLPVDENKLINIQRNFDLNDNIYTYLLEKRAEAGITKASNIPDIKVLDEASLNRVRLISPRSRMNYLIALFIGVFIPILILILRDYFNDKIIEKSDIENKTKAPILGIIGHNTRPTELVVKDNPKSSISESFRTIKTNLQYLLVEPTDKVITITSTVSGEGKTFCALNMASILAMTYKKTLLVGLDLRKPKIHKEFNIDNEKGISTYLIGKASEDDIIKETDIENLFITPSGPVPPNPAQLLESDRLIQFINAVKDKFEYIVIDTPPVALVSDALLFSKFSDSNIFVVRQSYSRKNVVELINELFQNKNIRNLNILINDVRLPSYYGYGYGYGYGYNYGYGYGYGYGYQYGYGYGEDYYTDDKPVINWFDKLLYILRIKK